MTRGVVVLKPSQRKITPTAYRMVPTANVMTNALWYRERIGEVVDATVEAVDAKDTTSPRKPAIIAKTVARVMRTIPEITYPDFNPVTLLAFSFR